MNTTSRILLLTLAAVFAPLCADAASEKRVSRFGTAPATSSIPGDEVVQVARQITSATGTKFIRNRGFGSMRPVFDTNSVLLVEEADYSTLKIGDIVLFEDKGRMVSHRIIEQRGERFWTQGDNNARPDNLWVTRENFRYRVWGVLYSNDYSLGLRERGATAASDPSTQMAEDADLGAL